MKKVFGALLMVVTLAFFSCRKNTVKPQETTGNTNQQETSIGQGTTNSTPAPDSLDNVKGWLRLQLTKDSINADNIWVAFDPSAQTAYVPGKDAPTLQGFPGKSFLSFKQQCSVIYLLTAAHKQRRLHRTACKRAARRHLHHEFKRPQIYSRSL